MVSSPCKMQLSKGKMHNCIVYEKQIKGHGFIYFQHPTALQYSVAPLPFGISRRENIRFFIGDQEPLVNNYIKEAQCSLFNKLKHLEFCSSFIQFTTLLPYLLSSLLFEFTFSLLPSQLKHWTNETPILIVIISVSKNLTPYNHFHRQYPQVYDASRNLQPGQDNKCTPQTILHFTNTL